MIIKVALFASAREVLGRSEIELELSPAATVAELKRELIKRFPDSEPLVLRSAVSVDHEFATEATKLNPDCEIALIPPVSGG